MSGLFYAMLAIVVGSSVIAIGGAGVTEMRPYVRRALEKIDSEAGNVKSQAQSASPQPSAQPAGEVDLTQKRPLTAKDAAAVSSGGVGPYDRPAS